MSFFNLKVEGIWQAVCRESQELPWFSFWVNIHTSVWKIITFLQQRLQQLTECIWMPCELATLTFFLHIDKKIIFFKFRLHGASSRAWIWRNCKQQLKGKFFTFTLTLKVITDLISIKNSVFLKHFHLPKPTLRTKVQLVSLTQVNEVVKMLNFIWRLQSMFVHMF